MTTFDQIGELKSVNLIVSASCARYLAESTKNKADLLQYLGTGIHKVFMIKSKHVHVDPKLPSTDFNIYDEFYSPVLNLKTITNKK